MFRTTAIAAPMPDRFSRLTVARLAAALLAAAAAWPATAADDEIVLEAVEPFVAIQKAGFPYVLDEDGSPMLPIAVTAPRTPATAAQAIELGDAIDDLDVANVVRVETPLSHPLAVGAAVEELAAERGHVVLVALRQKDAATASAPQLVQFFQQIARAYAPESRVWIEVQAGSLPAVQEVLAAIRAAGASNIVIVKAPAGVDEAAWPARLARLGVPNVIAGLQPRAGQPVETLAKALDASLAVGVPAVADLTNLHGSDAFAAALDACVRRGIGRIVGSLPAVQSTGRDAVGAAVHPATGEIHGEIARLQSLPPIDGALDVAWVNIPSQPFSPAETGESVSGHYRLGYDDTRLCLFVHVDDRTPNHDSKSPLGDDAVVLLIDGGDDKSADWGQNDWAITLPASGSRSVELNGRKAPDVAFAVRRTATGYDLEASVPFSALGGAPRPAALLGVAVGVVDDRNGGAGDATAASHGELNNIILSPRALATFRLGGSEGQGHVGVSRLTATGPQAMAAITVPDPGNSRSTAYNVGQFKKAQTKRFEGSIGGLYDPGDYYRIKTTRKLKMVIQLTGMTADGDLQLQKSNGASLAISAKSGAANEKIAKTLKKGTYYIRVDPYRSAITNYSLKIRSVLPAS